MNMKIERRKIIRFLRKQGMPAPLRFQLASRIVKGGISFDPVWEEAIGRGFVKLTHLPFQLTSVEIGDRYIGEIVY